MQQLVITQLLAIEDNPLLIWWNFFQLLYLVLNPPNSITGVQATHIDQIFVHSLQLKDKLDRKQALVES